MTEKTKWYLIIRSPDEIPREYSIHESTNMVGRSQDNDIFISDESASRNHAEFIYDSDKKTLSLRDLESTNGTYVNGKRILNLRYLEHEDQIRIGTQLITVLSRGVPNSQQTSEANTYSISRDFLIESIDNYGVLIHDIGAELNTLSDLNTALVNVSESIKHMVGADNCQVFLEEKFDQLEERGFPTTITNEVIEQKIAKIIPYVQEDSNYHKISSLKNTQSVLVVPVMKEDDVIGLIYLDKEKPGATAFDQRDLSLLVAVSHQISLSIQRKGVENQLLHDSNHDALTRLPNRTLYLDRLTQLIARYKRKKGDLFAVMFIDIDNFKFVNDSLGHLVGDELLVETTKRLASCIRDEDTLARLGGDEFAILVEDINTIEFIIHMAERIQEQFLEPVILDEKPVYVTVSTGIALNTINYEKPEDILRNADIAMYRAKEAGKANFAIYDEEMHENLLDRLHMQTLRRDAVNNDELRLHYQPIISLKEGNIVGFEALLRWQTSDGMIFPEKFFSTADTTGLLNKIDLWVLKSACDQIVQWNKDFDNDPPFHMAVNLSGKQLKHPNLVDQITKILEETKLVPELLWMEITESASLENSKITLKMLEELRKIGVNLSLDDFGTGFSSLSYLHKFPVNALKIDQSFVNRIGESVDGTQITQTISTLASALQMVSIAEGIETEEQLNFLRSIGTEYGQGYLFSKALAAKEITELLEQDPRW